MLWIYQIIILYICCQLCTYYAWINAMLYVTSVSIKLKTMRLVVRGHPRWMDRGEEFWQNMVHWRRKWQTNLAVRISWTIWKGRKIWHWKMSLPGQKVFRCYWGRVQAITNSSRKNEVVGPKQKWCPVVDVSGGESKVQCCKEKYCIGIWN